MYKDKEKQKQAQREASRRYRDKKGMTQEGMTEQGMTQASDEVARALQSQLPTQAAQLANRTGIEEMYATKTATLIGTGEPQELPIEFAMADTIVAVEVGTLEHYHSNPEMYATRTNPDRLNWGKSMTGDQLEQAGLKANRVPIPGDWDYEGVCVKTEAGTWNY